MRHYISYKTIAVITYSCPIGDSDVVKIATGWHSVTYTVHPKTYAHGSRSVVFCFSHDDVIKWKHFSRYGPFVRGIHRPRNDFILPYTSGSQHFSLWQSYNMPSVQCYWSDLGGRLHDDVIKWKLFLCCWPFLQIIHRSPVFFHHKGPVTRTLMLLWCA